MKPTNIRLYTAMILSAAVILTTCGKDSPTKPEPILSVTPVATRIDITPSTATLNAIGQTVQFSAKVFDQNNNLIDSAVVNWSSSAESVATVDAQGLVTAVKNGTARITATSGSAAQNVDVKVMQVGGSIVIEPMGATLTTIGQTVQFTATVLDQNGQRVANAVVTWSSSDESIATVDVQGMVTAVKNGTTRITATSGSAAQNVDVIVMQQVDRNIVIEPMEATLTAIGQTVQFTATVLDQNGQRVANAVVTWSSSAESVATVSAQGLVTAVKNGTARITATSGSAAQDVDVKVMQVAGSIVIEPNEITSENINSGYQLAATVLDENGHLVDDATVSWSSSDESVATVSAQGLVTSLKNGIARITASSGSATHTIDITVRVPIPSPDRDALIALYHATGGSGWKNNRNWLSDQVVGHWRGVTTDVDGRISKLILRNNLMSGSLPPEIGQLSALQHLDLQGNLLSGSLPPEIGQLSALQQLHLPDNLLDEPIPAEIGQLSALQYLTLEGNRISGSIPVEIGQLANLDTLRLGENHLTGEIPPSIGQLTRLKFFELHHNSLTGSIPPELGNLNELVRLTLSWNALTGEIPPEIGQLTKLETLWLFNNDLTGELQPAIGQLSSLKQLHAGGNKLTGEIPSEIGQLSSLVDLNLDVNQLSGEIPPEIGKLGNLEGLLLNENQLSGTIPPEIGQLGSLESLWLHENQLSGEIPPEIGKLDNLEGLLLNKNQLSGTIPPEIGQLGSLDRLWLTENRLSGELPSELGKLSNLVHLLASGNQLSSNIPPEIGEMSSLVLLHLQNNKLSGEIPVEIAQLEDLFELNLSNNVGIHGRLPDEFTRNSSLRLLYLDGTQICVPVGDIFDTWFSGFQEIKGDRCSPQHSSLVFLTQATQLPGNPVPLVAGDDALLRVFVIVDEQHDVDMPAVRVTFYHDEAEVHNVEIPGQGSKMPSEVDAGSLSSSANAVIPGSIIQPGLELVVDIDPEDTLDPILNVPSRIPETGRKTVVVREVPVLDLTLVPFLWRQDPDYSVVMETNSLTAEDDLFRATRDLLPVRDFKLSILDPVLTDIDPDLSDEKREYTTRVLLSEVKMIRAMDGGNGHYMGVLRGGGGATTSGGRTLISNLHEGFIAHELGHAMDLAHSPCGTAGSFLSGDPRYPYSDGSIGTWGYDIVNDKVVSPDTPDLMGYCLDTFWISAYNFKKALDYRVNEEVSQLMTTSGQASRSLVVWGGVDESGNPILEPSFAVIAPSSLPPRGGPYQITGLDILDNVLFSMRFDMDKIVDGTGKTFTFILPMRGDWTDRLAHVSLSGPEGVVEIDGGGEKAYALLLDSISGRVRGILRDWSEPGSSSVFARRMLPEPGLDVVISTGIPDPSDW